MRLVAPLTLVLVAFSIVAVATEALQTRIITPLYGQLPGPDWVNFDLIDLHEAERLPPLVSDAAPHTRFVTKQHVGVAGGYDNSVVHGSIGLYVTVAELGRWNFGVPSPALGFGRYPTLDAKSRQETTKTALTLFVSVASVHYRLGRLQSLGMNSYLTLEQIFDVRATTMGSQVGVTVSTK